MLKPLLTALATVLAVAPASAQAEMGHGDQMMMITKMLNIVTITILPPNSRPA